MPRRKTERKDQIGHRKEVRDQLRKVFQAVEKGFQDQGDRSDNIMDCWDAYLCKWTSNQFYSGNSQAVVPLVHNAVEARKTRFLNQLFPQVGRYVEVTTEDGEVPHPIVALQESYVERARLKTDVVPAMLISGDIEGQYTLLVTWETKKRHIVSRETEQPKIAGDIENPAAEPVTTARAHADEDSGPAVELVPDADLLILPATAESADAALEQGGSVTTICRWSRSRVEELIESGEIESSLSADLLTEMDNLSKTGRDLGKHMADAAGIKASGKYLQVYRTWTRIKVDGERRLVLAYYGGLIGEGEDAEDQILGAKLCPYWCDKPDVISRPVRKLPNLAKGASLVARCLRMQYIANDFTNLGVDSGVYSMLPVIMTDPERNPKTGSMVMDLMAVWEVDPRSTQPLSMPQLYQHAFQIVQGAERYIMATLSVNAAMLPQSTGVPGRKRNQAEIAMEQQIDLLSTAVEIGAAEAVLSELVERFAEYDMQFRDTEMLVRTVGELGVKAEMMTVPPLQIGRRWRFRWFGVEATRTQQQAQQQIAGLNVLQQWSQHPAVREAGYQFNPVPVIRTVVETTYGPRIAPEIFKNIRDQLTIPPEVENEMLMEAFELPTSPGDDDPKHLQSHLAAAQQVDMRLSGDPTLMAVKQRFAHHIAAHQRQMQMKQAAQMMQKLQQTMQQQGAGRPQIAGPRPPQPGAAPAMPRAHGPGGRLPPGMARPTAVPQPGGVVPMPVRR